MAGFRDFQTGEVLTSANVDDFLAKQAVMKFADAAARDTALGTAVGGSNALREGMVAYLDDTDDLQVYNGTAWSGVGYRYAGTRYYTSSGTFAKADPLGTGDIGLRAIRVRCQGGGGGGGGCAATGAGEVSQGGAGSGGGYAESFITDIPGLAASVTVTRGSGGAGGSAGAAGSSGANSSFGAIVIGDGGGPGNGGSVYTPPNYGATSNNPGGGTGDLVVPGSRGMRGVLPIVTGVASAEIGDSFLSGRPSGGSTGSGATGAAGVLYGGGGGSGINAQNQGTARDGGNGGNGIVIVDCFV